MLTSRCDSHLERSNISFIENKLDGVDLKKCCGFWQTVCSFIVFVFIIPLNVPKNVLLKMYLPL